MRRTLAALSLFAIGLGFAIGPADARPLDGPPASTFFATVGIDPGATVGAPAVGDGREHGDLWPSCWSNDDHVYTSYGDGEGFGSGWFDIGVARISGMPGNLFGAQLARGDEVGRIWGNPADYYRKPTGMVCVDGALYLAVQDLRKGSLNEAPSATIVKSTDKGRTWTGTAQAMFTNHRFTTVMFLDYGKDNVDSPDGFVYAYGLDHNWRDSFDPGPDPYDVYLARVPKATIQDISTWRYFSGTPDNPQWTNDINQRTAVLHDDRRIYQNVGTAGRVRDLSMISQGGIVYNKPLNRYIYTSWTEYTFEFYESPTPWGPWRHFTPKDFGGYPWSRTKHGGYATTIPSKYITADGKTMWLQSNVCPCGGGFPAGEFWAYTFSLRRMTLEPATPSSPGNGVDGGRNLAREPGTVPIERATHVGRAIYNDGIRAQNEDDWNDERKPTSWWGYTWPRQYNLNKVVYTTGTMFGDGGWFATAPSVQVRRNGTWTTVSGLRATPGYPTSSAAGTNRSYVFSFDATSGDGIRLIGGSGGSQTFTSIGELEVYYGSAVTDPSFEAQPSGSISAPWEGEGPGEKGIDRGIGFAQHGANNAWIHTSGTAWNAIKQTVPVLAGTNYRLTGWIQNSGNFSGGYFGVRNAAGAVHAETNHGALPGYTQLTVDFNSGSNTTMTVFGGYWAPNTDSWMRLDNVTLAVQQ